MPFLLSNGEKRLVGLGLVFEGLELPTCARNRKGEEAEFSVVVKQYTGKHLKNVKL